MKLLLMSLTYLTSMLSILSIRREVVFHSPFEKKLNATIYCEMSANHFLLCHLLWKELRDSLKLSAHRKCDLIKGNTRIFTTTYLLMTGHMERCCLLKVLHKLTRQGSELGAEFSIRLQFSDWYGVTK